MTDAHLLEPRIVVAQREDVWWLLSEAAPLEHMIMCQYLFAAFSLKQGTDEGLTAEQAAVVNRWRETLYSIALDEMLHLALVANLSTAIGAAPTFGRPNFPQRSGYFPSPIQLDLLPFGEQALQHFLYLERPEGMERQDARGFVATAPAREPLTADETMPRGQEYATIGHLYRGIGDGLKTLVARVGEQAVFVGSRRAQATPELFHLPELIPVTDLTSASAAVAKIIEQGEGARGDWRQAHYGWFLALFEEYQELRARNPAFEPTRPVLAAYTRQPFDNPAPVPIITEPRTRDVANLAALAYELVLQTLNRFFTHTDETDQQLATLVRVAVGLMSGVLSPLATELTKLPVGAPHAGRTAGFAFEMFYALGNFVPRRESAWALLHERTSLLAERCTTAAADPHAPEGIRQAQHRATALAALLRRESEEREMTAQQPKVDLENLPAPAEGILVTHFLIVRDVARSRAFYADVLGGQVVLEENPCIVKLANSWIIMNPGGGPTPDKPGIWVVPYEPSSQVSSFLNLRVADIQACYRDWKAKGATFVTEPIARGAEVRCYMRDPDGYLIEVGQATGMLVGKFAPSTSA